MSSWWSKLRLSSVSLSLLLISNWRLFYVKRTIYLISSTLCRSNLAFCLMLVNSILRFSRACSILSLSFVLFSCCNRSSLFLLFNCLSLILSSCFYRFCSIYFLSASAFCYLSKCFLRILLGVAFRFAYMLFNAVDTSPYRILLVLNPKAIIWSSLPLFTFSSPLFISEVQTFYVFDGVSVRLLTLTMHGKSYSGCLKIFFPFFFFLCLAWPLWLISYASILAISKLYWKVSKFYAVKLNFCNLFSFWFWQV